MARYVRIFASLDGASTQYAVARRALSIAHDNNAEVLFGHVIDSVPYEANGIDFSSSIIQSRALLSPLRSAAESISAGSSNAKSSALNIFLAPTAHAAMRLMEASK